MDERWTNKQEAGEIYIVGNFAISISLHEYKRIIKY
jgi:hypothetical protein